MGNSHSVLPPLLGDMTEKAGKDIRKYSGVEDKYNASHVNPNTVKPPPVGLSAPQTFDPKAPRTSIMEGPTNPSMLFDTESKPSAIVVGAGLPGVHVAYELARRGFEVEVLEAQSTAGSGNTAFMHPVLGEPFIPLPLDRLSSWASYKHAFGISSFDPWVRFPDISSVFSSRKMLKDHVKPLRRLRASREDITSLGNSLSVASVVRVREMLVEHPQLRSSVVGCEAPNAPLPLTSETLTIRPLRWTQSLARICSEKYNVKFTFDTEVTSVTDIDYSNEHVLTGLTTRGSEGGVRSIGVKRADLYVFAAGVSNPSILTYLVGSSPLLVTKDTAAVFELKRKLSDGAEKNFQQRGPVVESIKSVIRRAEGVDDFMEASVLSREGAIRYQRSEIPFSNTSSIESGMLVGGQTIEPKYFPCTEKGKPLDIFTNILDRLAASNSIPTLSAKYTSIKNNADAEAKHFHCYTFHKTTTPDGLPIASRVGPIFNAFVLGGFGHHSPALGPQAASSLAHFIAHPRDDDITSPLPLQRYDPTSKRLQPQARIRSAEERVGDDTRSLFSRTANVLNKQISQPISECAHSFALNVLLSDKTPPSIKDYLYNNFVTAEDEEKLFGVKPTTPLQSFPRISPETVLQPPDLPKSMDFKETVTKKRDF